MPVQRHVWTIIAVVPFRFPISVPIGAASPRPFDGFAGTRPVATVPRRAAPFARLLVLLAAILGLAAAAAVAAADVKLAYRVVIDAPAALKTPLEQGLDLVRWQDFEYMTDDLLDRLIQEAIEQVKDVAAAQGYFSTTTDIAVQRPAAGSGLPLTLRVVVDPGPATRVTSAAVSVVGPAATDSPAGTDAAALARDGWRLRVGDVFRQAAWLEAKTVAVATVTASPYAAARITHSEARIDPDEQSAELTVVIESGPRFTFGRIEVAGLKRYPESVVRNFSDIAVGEPFSERRLDQLIRRLNTSGYFASVHAWIDPDPEQADEAPLQVRVIEARPKSLSGGIELLDGHPDSRQSALQRRRLR